MPRGVAVKVRIAGRNPPDVVLSVQDSLESPQRERPWRPGPDGSMDIIVPPDQASLRIRADDYFERTARGHSFRRLAEGAVTVREGAELVLTPWGK